MRKTIKRMVVLLALLCVCLSFFAGCSSKNGGYGKDGLHIAMTGNSFSSSFIERFNPLYAESEAEYAAGLLVVPTIMRYEEGKGWVSVLGTISVSKENGKTVAMIELDKNIRYSNGRKLSADEYIRVVTMILRTNYNGYFKDFYTYPIEGLVACRYNCQGLTLADLPDFDAELEKVFKKVYDEDIVDARKAYEKLLSDTKIFGLYDGNPLTLSPDGRTFRQVLEQDGSTMPADDYFTAGDVERVMLADLCKLYARKDRSLWMIDQLKVSVMQQLQDDFEKECLEKGQRVNGVISGVNRYSSTAVKVIFEKTIEDENKVIEMLNLPLLHSFMDDRSNVVGAGAYTYQGYSKGREGNMVILEAASGKNLYLRTANAEDVYATLYMGQLSAAAIEGAYDEEQVKKYKLSVKSFGDCSVVYHSGKITEKELESLAMLFA